MVVSYIQVEPNLQCDKNYANFIDISKRMAASHNNEYASLKEGDSLSEAEKHGWMVARLLARKFCN